MDNSNLLFVFFLVLVIVLIYYYNLYPLRSHRSYLNLESDPDYSYVDPLAHNVATDGSLSWYYNYKPKGDCTHFGKNEAVPTSTLKSGAKTLKRPGNIYLLDIPKKELLERPVTVVRLLTAKTCRMSKLESAFWNTKREVQDMGHLGKLIDFKVELYDYANPKNLQYSLPIVVKEVQTDKGLQLFKFNDLLYGPRSDVMIQWVFGDGRLF